MSTQQQPHPGSSIAWKNAPTKSVDVGGTKFVYRELGLDTGLPVIFLNHLAAELDRWDPRVVDGIASRRRVIAFDNRANDFKTELLQSANDSGFRRVGRKPRHPVAKSASATNASRTESVPTES